METIYMIRARRFGNGASVFFNPKHIVSLEFINGSQGVSLVMVNGPALIIDNPFDNPYRKTKPSHPEADKQFLRAIGVDASGATE